MFFIRLFLANTWNKNRGSPSSFKRKGEFIPLSGLVWGYWQTRTHCCSWFFLGCANWETFVADTKCFWTKSETFFVSRTQNLCPQQMLRARVNGKTFVSAAMCPQQCVLVCQYLEGNLLRFARARAHVRALMTRKSCAVGMRNAILRNYLKAERLYFTSIYLKTHSKNWCEKSPRLL